MGKDAGFSWFPNWSVAINSRENRVKPLSNIYKQRLTVSKHATNETKYSVLRRVRAQRDCPRRHAFANYLKLDTLTHDKEWRSPLGRTDTPDDDTLAMTVLADSDLPTLLLTDFKI